MEQIEILCQDADDRDIKFNGGMFDPRADSARGQKSPALLSKSVLSRQTMAGESSQHPQTALPVVIYSVYIATYKSFAIQRKKGKKFLPLLSIPFVDPSYQLRKSGGREGSENVYRNLW